MSTPTKFILGLAVALGSTAVYAEDLEEQFEDGFQILIAGGIASLDQDGSIDVTSNETDTLVQGDEGWDSWTAKVGVGYQFPLMENEDDDEDDLQWLPNLTPQLNLYYLGGGDIDGDVLRYENSNQADYSMDYSSTRLMFDLALTLASMERFSVYVLGGLGASWNNTSLETTPTSEFLPFGFELEDSDSTTFAYEFGAGIGYAITDDIGISLEYLYANLGDVEVQGNASLTGGDYDADDPRTLDIENSDVEISSQSILLGLNFAL